MADIGPDTKTIWEPSINGNKYSSLKDTFEVTELKEASTDAVKVFQNTHPPHGPGGYTRAFGGHVYGQAVVAAAKTVRAGFFVHSITGHFLLLGRTDIPFTYKVSVIRTGESYAQRRVDVVQKAKKGPIFTAVVSFKISEGNSVTCIKRDQLREKYAAVIAGREPESWPLVPSIDIPSWYSMDAENGPDPFPGLDMRKVDMTKYNQSQRALDRIQLQYYRAIAPLPSVMEESALHACGHLYASDRNSLFTIPNSLGEGDACSNVASLSITVIFHDEAETYSMLDAQGNPKWFCIEAAIEHISYGRGLISGKLWDVSSGRPVASYVQDGLVRMKENIVQSADGESIKFLPSEEDTSQQIHFMAKEKL